MNVNHDSSNSPGMPGCELQLRNRDYLASSKMELLSNGEKKEKKKKKKKKMNREN